MEQNMSKAMKLISVLIILGTITTIQCTSVYSVGKLTVSKHPQVTAINKTITLTPLSYHEHLSNMEMMRIRVVKASPFDACSPINTTLIYPDATKAYPDTFLLVDGREGVCNYWKKAQMAKEALVKGIIIINDEPEKNANRPADYTDGLFLSFLIKPKDTNLIIPLSTSQFQAKLSITQTTEAEDKKKIYLWLSSLNAQSYEYLKWWNETLHNLPELDKKIDWQPKYVFYGKTTDENRHVYSCVCNGLFCSPEYRKKSHQNNLDGKTADALIKQDLRQKLIFKYYPEKYLRYIQLFTDRCLENYLKEKYTEECSKTQMINAQISQSVINNEIYNFESKCDEDKELFGEMLTDKGRFSMIGSYPIILLNRQIVRFFFIMKLQVDNQHALQTAICRKLSLEESQGCIQNYRTTTNEIVISVVFFILILAGLFGVGFFIVMCYKNKLRKEMHKQVKMQVSTAVEHYFQLSEDTSSAK